MGRISHTAAITKAATSLAARQHGVATRAQLRRVGLSDDRIDGWVRAGHLRRVVSGVYAVGRPGITERGRLHAVVLACGPGASISHRSAAWLLGLREKNPVVVDVICPGQAGRKVDGIRVHKVPYPAPSELRPVFGIPCTTVARTVVDLAGVHGIEKLRESVEMAASKNMLDIGAIDAVLANGPRRRGTPALRTVVDEWRPVAETARYATIRSLFEAKLLPLIAAAGLPIPRINARVRTAERILEVDLLWPEQRFVVEADSRRHHAIEVAFERDHRRDRELLAAGYGTQRVSWREAEREPDAVLAVVRSELEARQRAGPTLPT
jgi:very-short-patch-repair endonuclease